MGVTARFFGNNGNRERYREALYVRFLLVYLLGCADGTLYTSWAFNMAVRLRVHNAGKGAKYTRARRPVTLLYAEALPDRSAALRREAQIKQHTWAEKLALVEKGSAFLRLFRQAGE